MVGIGEGFFVHFPGASQYRVLHPAKIVAINNHVYTAEFGKPEQIVEAEQDILLYYEAVYMFVQQPARVECVAEAVPKLVVRFVTTGEPSSAESREYYRVSTVTSDLVVNVGPEENCKLLDVSVTGLSVIAEGFYGIGRVLDLRIAYDGEEFSGQGCVQSVKQLKDGKTRYGLLCTVDAAAGGDIRRGLRQVTKGIQRQQLRRLAVVN
ncbi:MAG: PilZ domain-containing protein [Planctomycetota bacterium]|jgi:hypothetical protein